MTKKEQTILIVTLLLVVIAPTILLMQPYKPKETVINEDSQTAKEYTEPEEIEVEVEIEDTTPITDCTPARTHEERMDKEGVKYYTGRRVEDYFKFCLKYPKCECDIEIFEDEQYV